MTRTPATYTVNEHDLLTLVAESPRFDLLFGEIRRGRATARELASLLWPTTPPDEPQPCWHGLSPVQALAERLDHAARPCAVGGSGLATRDGEDYVVDVEFAAGRVRHPRLPRWPAG